MTPPPVMSRRDLDFMLHEWLEVDQLLSRERFAEHSRETIDGLLDLSESLATKYFLPAHRLADREEPVIDADGKAVLVPEVVEAVRRYGDAGLQASTFDAELGGMQVPYVVHTAATQFFQAAGVGPLAYAFLAAGGANLVVAHGTQEQIDTYARPVIEGRWHGTMCLSEPQAGSSLADITTRAERCDDGSYRIFGTKTWISAGDHEIGENIVHLVLARTPGGPPGVKGISLFIVPKHLVGDDGAIGERNDVALVGLNHKMGYRATTNTVLNFGEGMTQPNGAPGAVGYLIGQENRGLAQMFHLMNEARIGVGAGAVALGYSGFLQALEYAKGRPQGRPVTNKDPRSPMVALVEHPDVRRMLLAQKAYVEGGLALVLWCARLVDEQATHPDQNVREEAHVLLETLTPIAKSWPSQWCLAANDLAIQVHGGAGYTRDYPVEMLYRDNRLNPIHEGTHGIQALDLLGRKVVADRGRGLQLLVAAMRGTSAEGRRVEELAPYAARLEESIDRLVSVTDRLWADGDPQLALANASLYLEAAGHVVVAWMWLEQMIAAAGGSETVHRGKRAAGHYFHTFELPTVGPKLDLLESLDRQTLDLDTDVL